MKTDVESHDHWALDVWVAVIWWVVAHTKSAVFKDAGLVAKSHVDRLAKKLLLEREGERSMAESASHGHTGVSIVGPLGGSFPHSHM